jgi:hypothetical protein
MNIREQIINFLLQSNDQKDQIIAELQAKIAELEKAAQPAAEVAPAPETAPAQ